MRSKVLAVASGLALVLGLVSVEISAGPAGASVSSQATSAVNYAHANGYRSAIGVLDTQTGAFTGAGDYNSTYASESVMKTFIATRLLMTGQMSGWNETTAYKMITQSDDASASALYGRVGGDSLINWVKQALNIPNLGYPPLRSGWWGGTQITAAGMASFYNAVRHRPAIWNWLGNAMHHATPYGSDGVYQFFGIPSATTGFAVKQGWGADNSAGQPAFNSTGFVNGDRYAVVILTQGGSYGTPIANMVTAEARLLMPGGKIASDDPFGGVSSWSLHGRYLTVTGWALDPNALSSELRIFFYVNGKPFTYVQTTLPRGDINAHFHASGNHGYSKTLMLANGTNNVCAYAINVGAGNNTKLGCRTVALDGSPIGGISSVTQKGNLATFTGWSFDYDAPDTGLTVVANVNGRYAGSVGSTVSRPDINAAMHGTGPHGYLLKVRVPAGASTVCLHALNRGAGHESRLGCASFRVSLSPIGKLDSVTVQGSRALVTGWTFDFSDTAQAIGTVVDDNGKHVAWGPTKVVRNDVNTAWSITGAHGFSYSVALSPGTNRICAYGVNVGTGGGNSLLGCRSVSPASGAAAAAPATPAPSPATSAPAQSSAPSASTPAGSSPAESSAPVGSSAGPAPTPSPSGSGTAGD
ncbi:hypothetical protein [Jatrophihabitans sp.]|uniref:hypothetical protein n=1 Tax=Jatrophihabitans sp. TaxID=1932789 RepID=UPI002B94C36D|nr:hypothetical protein [Jatrophihabitans sp.]